MLSTHKRWIRSYFIRGKAYTRHLKASRIILLLGFSLVFLAIVCLSLYLQLSWQASIAIAVTVSTLILNVMTVLPTEMIFLGGLATLLISGVLNVETALAGFSNPGMVTVGVLYIVIAGVEQTGGLAWISQHLLGLPRTPLRAMLRLIFPVVGMSAFLNNTPIVALFIPVVTEWSKKLDIAPSRLMIPLSYSAIFGGICTLVGTSTNLVVNGLLITHTQHPGLGIFEITKVSLPCALVGCLYLLTIGRRLLPVRQSAINPQDNLRQYTLEMRVEHHSPLVGKTIEQAGLRHLTGLYLSDIIRGDEMLNAVGPRQRLYAEDHLIFVGMIDSITELRKMPGLVLADHPSYQLETASSEHYLIEVVVSNTFPFVGQTIRDCQFRKQYDAVVVAVGRNGDRLSGKIGDIELQPGDALLLEVSTGFLNRYRHSRDFYVISRVPNSETQRVHLAPTALMILVGMMCIVTMGWSSMLVAAVLAAVLMVALRCCAVERALKGIDWSLLMVIAASLGLGKALETTGAAAALASVLIEQTKHNPYLAIGLIYLATMLLTEMITNNAAAALVFPIGLSVAEDLGVNFIPFVIAIMIAASASFATPIGYQTNLMVYSPGGYRFTDFMRVGIPLNIIFFMMTIMLTPLFFPF